MADGYNFKQLAQDLGVATSTILRAARRRGMDVAMGPGWGAPKAARLTPAQADEIRRDIEGRRANARSA